jgi:hypothetical protein
MRTGSRGRRADAVQGRAGEGVEGPTAVAAAELRHRVAAATRSGTGFPALRGTKDVGIVNPGLGLPTRGKSHRYGYEYSIMEKPYGRPAPAP